MDLTPLLSIGAVAAGLIVAGIILARGARRDRRMWAVLQVWKAEAKRANPEAPDNPRFSFYGSVDSNGIVRHTTGAISMDGGVNWRSLNQRELDVLDSMGIVPKK